MILLTRILLLCGLLLPSCWAFSKPVLLDRIAAIVDDDIIMLSELDERTEEIKQRMGRQGGNMPPSDVLREQILERMIIESIELQMANRAGIRVSDNEINDTIANIAEQNNLDLDQFRQSVIADGLTWPSLRDQIRREILINQVRQRQLGRRIKISDQDIETFLNSEIAKAELAPDYRLGHILVAASREGSMEQAETRAMNLYQQLQSGADFASLAAQYSASETALQGGDLGWREASQLPTLFADRVINMTKGEIAPPMEAGSGYHIIKVLDLRGGSKQVVKQTQVRHILVKPNEIRSEKETKRLINEIHQQLLENPDQFEILAKTYSDDPGSALQGGELGWVTPGTMVPEFEQTMAATEAAELSAPFRSDFGWHVLQVQDRRQQDMSAEFRHNQARQMLQRRKFDEALDGWLREIRQDAFVEIKL